MADSVRVIDRGWKRLRKQWRDAQGRGVNVGVVGKEANKPHQEGPATVGQVATWNHFGTGTIPARPFISQPLNEKLDEFRTLLARVTKGVNQGKLTIAQGLNLVGVRARDVVVSAINARKYAENAPSTIARKGSSTPLVDTGQLKGSIGYEIVK